MSDKQQFLITVRFPSWSQGERKYPAFGVKYLIETPIFEIPDWPEDDERWLRYDDFSEVRNFFLKRYDDVIGHGEDFKGEILFIDPVDYCKL